MSILIFSKSNKWLWPHMSSSACYHGNLKASEYWRGGLKAIGGEHGFDTQEGYQVGKREVSAAHTSHVLSSWECHIREQKTRKSAQECKMSLMSHCTSSRVCLCTATLCSLFLTFQCQTPCLSYYPTYYNSWVFPFFFFSWELIFS